MVSTVIALVVAGGLFAGSAQNARAEEQDAPAIAEMVVRRPVRQLRSRGVAARAEGLQGSLHPPVTGCRISRSAISLIPAVPGIPLRRRRPSHPNTRSRLVRTIRARCSSGRAGRPITFPRHFQMRQAARVANGGALPPDLSLITKARSYERGFPKFIFDFFTQFQEQGPNYVDAILPGL